MKHKKTNIITLMRLVIEQKQTIDDQAELIEEYREEISQLRVEKEVYRRELLKLKEVADILTPIPTRTKNFMNGVFF